MVEPVLYQRENDVASLDLVNIESTKNLSEWLLEEHNIGWDGNLVLTLVDIF